MGRYRKKLQIRDFINQLLRKELSVNFFYRKNQPHWNYCNMSVLLLRIVHFNRVSRVSNEIKAYLV